MEIVQIINQVGFPIAVSILLLYDKLKSNGALKRVVENNNLILCDIRQYLLKGGIAR